MIQFIALIILLLIASAVGINGFYAITRGRWESKPDGQKYWTGKIFNKWNYFLQRHTTKRVFYENDEWRREFCKLESFFKAGEIREVNSTCAVVSLDEEVKVDLLRVFAVSKGVNLFIRVTPPSSVKYVANEKVIFLSAFKEEKVYKIHYYISDPLGLCITCMASVYGTICYLFWFFAAKYINSFYPSTSVNVWMELSWFFKFGLWAFFCFSLAYLNELVLHLNKKLEK